MTYTWLQPIPLLQGRGALGRLATVFAPDPEGMG